MLDSLLCDDDGPSKAGDQRYDGSISLVDDVMLIAKGCVSSVAIIDRFPSGSICVNLRFQLCDKTLKSLYLPELSSRGVPLDCLICAIQIKSVRYQLAKQS